jgi:hypothetical protein
MCLGRSSLILVLPRVYLLFVFRFCLGRWSLVIGLGSSVLPLVCLVFVVSFCPFPCSCFWPLFRLVFNCTFLSRLEARKHKRVRFSKRLLCVFVFVCHFRESNSFVFSCFKLYSLSLACHATTLSRSFCHVVLPCPLYTP